VKVPPESPVLVAGAGPAGLAAALTANHAGREVIVYERSPEVGHRFHDDFEGLENWSAEGDVLDELESLGIDPTFDHTPVREVIVFDPRWRAHTYRSQRPFLYLVRRGSSSGTLDTALKRQALMRGVQIRFGEAYHPESGIVAHGPRGADAIVVGHVFETTAADGAYAVLSDRLAPKGYAYLLVVRGRGTVASCMFADFRGNESYLERTVAFFREHVGFDMRNPLRFGGAGNTSVPTTARRGRTLFVGEAAGFQDALWGFGMRYAMLSGSLAARAMVSGQVDDYDRLWKRRLGGILRAGVVNRLLYATLAERGYAGLLWLLDRTADPRAWLRRLYRPSLLTSLLYPLARRRRTLLARPRPVA
jgi:flavin-dependent dehydrogenase